MDADRAIADLMATSGDRLLRLAYQLTHERASAEDLVQEALMQVYRSWRRRAPEIEHAEAYVRRAIVNEQLRRGRLRSSTELITHTPPERPVAQAFDTDFAERERVWQALAELAPRQRTVLVLRYYEDLPDAEIATLIGAREATVRSLAARGLAALRASDGALVADGNA